MPMRANTCATPSSDAADREREEHAGQIEHGGGIALLDGVEDRAIPDVDAVLKADIA